MGTDYNSGQHSMAIEKTGEKTRLAQSHNSTSYSFLCFYLDGQEYGVVLNQVKQIVQLPEVTWVPRTKAHVLGVISIRGGVVTLVDARQLIGLEPSSRPKSARVLLTYLNEETIGLLVDSVSQVRRVPVEAFEANPALDESPQTEHVLGIARPETEMQITIIDLVEMLAEKMR